MLSSVNANNYSKGYGSQNNSQVSVNNDVDPKNTSSCGNLWKGMKLIALFGAMRTGLSLYSAAQISLSLFQDRESGVATIIKKQNGNWVNTTQIDIPGFGAQFTDSLQFPLNFFLDDNQLTAATAVGAVLTTTLLPALATFLISWYCKSNKADGSDNGHANGNIHASYATSGAILAALTAANVLACLTYLDGAKNWSKYLNTDNKSSFLSDKTAIAIGILSLVYNLFLNQNGFFGMSFEMSRALLKKNSDQNQCSALVINLIKALPTLLGALLVSAAPFAFAADENGIMSKEFFAQFAVVPLYWGATAPTRQFFIEKIKEVLGEPETHDHEADQIIANWNEHLPHMKYQYFSIAKRLNTNHDQKTNNDQNTNNDQKTPLVVPSNKDIFVTKLHRDFNASPQYKKGINIVMWVTLGAMMQIALSGYFANTDLLFNEIIPQKDNQTAGISGGENLLQCLSTLGFWIFATNTSAKVAKNFIFDFKDKKYCSTVMKSLMIIPSLLTAIPAASMIADTNPTSQENPIAWKNIICMLATGLVNANGVIELGKIGYFYANKCTNGRFFMSQENRATFQTTLQELPDPNEFKNLLGVSNDV